MEPIRYFTGIPCRKGHIAERYTKSGKCCECHIRSAQRWQAANRDVYLASVRAGRRKYLQYPTPTYKAPGYCEICGTTDSGKNDWNFDHNHVTNAFRGWLCSRCNGALGMLKDDPDLLDKAAAYLRTRN